MIALNINGIAVKIVHIEFFCNFAGNLGRRRRESCREINEPITCSPRLG